MSKVLIIGAGGVAGVVVQKCAKLPEVFSEIHLASRTLSKCQALQEKAGKDRVVGVYQVDADDAAEVAGRFFTRNCFNLNIQWFIQESFR